MIHTDYCCTACVSTYCKETVHRPSVGSYLEQYNVPCRHPGVVGVGRRVARQREGCMLWSERIYGIFVFRKIFGGPSVGPTVSPAVSSLASVKKSMRFECQGRDALPCTLSDTSCYTFKSRNALRVNQQHCKATNIGVVHAETIIILRCGLRTIIERGAV